MASKSTSYNSNFWNKDLLEFIAQRLGEPQNPYIRGASVSDFSEGQETISISVSPSNGNQVQTNESHKTNFSGLNQGVLNISRIPEHLADKLKGVTDIVDNLYILKVNTKNSLLHSILGLLEESYRTAPWEKKEYMVSLFRGKIFSDMERNKDLNDRLKHAKITKTSIQKDIQEKYPTDLLKFFISVYFGINLIIVSDKIETVPKTIDRYAPSLLLYQYPFGNIAPIIQGHQEDQTMILSKSPILLVLFGQNFNETIKSDFFTSLNLEKEVPCELHNDGLASQSDIKPHKIAKITQKIAKLQTPFNNTSPEKVDPEKEKKEKELLKLTLPEIQILCTSHGIETKKPASKKDTWKNLTKKELVELLSDKYAI